MGPATAHVSQLVLTEEQFAAANEAWAREVRGLYGGNPYSHRDRPSGRGEPGTPLRVVFEARAQAFQRWCSEPLQVSRRLIGLDQAAKACTSAWV